MWISKEMRPSWGHPPFRAGVFDERCNLLDVLYIVRLSLVGEPGMPQRSFTLSGVGATVSTDGRSIQSDARNRNPKENGTFVYSLAGLPSLEALPMISVHRFQELG